MFLIVGLALSVATCRPTTDGGSTAAAAFTPTATVQDIMLSMVDPSADEIWESVATIVSADGVEERRPRTDEDWKVLHADAIRLVEATNLLLMDRKVAASNVKSENPGIELEPEEIQLLIDEDMNAWKEHVRGLYDVSKVMLDAIDAHDADKLFDNGGPLDEACESCHRQYWYPPENDPQLPADASTVGPETAAAATGSSREVADTGGSIEGHVRLSGKSPGNRVVRMGMDPKCTEIYAGTPAVEEIVAADAEGDLANVFVKLEGTFPPAPVPEEPLVIDQQKCFFVPRVAAARVGQTVEFRNSDALGHNVHALSQSNRFNFSEPTAGIARPVTLEPESTSDGVLHVKCDVHRWMNAFIGVVDHPYFSVSDTAGAFSLSGVPPGDYTITAWHERLGVLEEKVTVEPGKTATVDFDYQAVAS